MARLRQAEPLDELFDVVRKSEEAVLEATRKWVHATGELMPVEMPVLHDVVYRLLDFTEEMLKVQREFAHNMLEAVRSVEMPTLAPTTTTHMAPTATTRRTRPATTPTRKAA